MTLRDLREKYSASNYAQAVGRAVRAEIPGGSEILDTLQLWHKINQRGRASDLSAIAPGIFAALREARDLAEDEIRRRYGVGKDSE